MSSFVTRHNSSSNYYDSALRVASFITARLNDCRTSVRHVSVDTLQQGLMTLVFLGSLNRNRDSVRLRALILCSGGMNDL